MSLNSLPSGCHEMCYDSHRAKFIDFYKYIERVFKEEMKGGSFFPSSEFTRRNVLPVGIPWNLFILSTFAIESRHTHVCMCVCRCHWHAVQVALSQSCWDHLWDIRVRVQGAPSAPEPVSIIVWASVGFQAVLSAAQERRPVMENNVDITMSVSKLRM